MSRRAPRQLSDALGALTREIAPPGTLADVQRVWEAAVGEAIAAEASPVAERDGVLSVVCSASVWAAELTMMGARVAEQINDALGEPGRIVELRCRSR